MTIETEAHYVSRRRPLYPVFLQFPVVCFTLALLTDATYWYTEYLMWQNFSSWLLLAGNASAAVTAVVAIIDYFLGNVDARFSWPLIVGGILVFVLSFLNSLVHAGDGWTAVVPWGLSLSIATVVVMIVTALVQRMTVRSLLVERHHDG